jgi:2-iminoacetate synthase
MKNTTFYETFKKFDWEGIQEAIYSATPEKVERTLEKTTSLSVEDFLVLVSPAAKQYLPQLIQQSRNLTRQRFGNTIQFYIPMYVSNECQNICTYCGFSFNNKMPRITLNKSEILREVEIIKKHGFDHLLIVSGESARNVGLEYFKEVIKTVRPYFSNISIEVQPLEENDYKTLINEGLYSVLVYQETYNESRYKTYHPKGKKSNFEYRLDTPDRLGRAAIHKIGLGALLGLEDWRTEAWFLALHLSYLRKKYWQTRFSISFPRLRPAEGIIDPLVNVNDQDLMQLIAAYRLFDNNIELSISTRERAEFREFLTGVGITSMSAGSCTDPGGYANQKGALKQFNIDDSRSPQEVANSLSKLGLEVVWKDWDRGFNEQQTNNA